MCNKETGIPPPDSLEKPGPTSIVPWAECQFQSLSTWFNFHSSGLGKVFWHQRVYMFFTSTRMIRVSTSFGRSVIKRMNKPRHNPKHMCRAFWSTSRTGGALRGRSAQISKQGKSGLWAEGSIKSGDLQEMQSVGQTPNKISAPHRAPSRD